MSEQLIGKKCYEHFKTHDCNTENCATAKAFRQGTVANSVAKAKPGNKEIDIRYSSLPLTDNDGNIVAAFEMFVDETEIQNTMRLNKKLADYRQRQTEKIVSALQMLSEGEVNFKISLDEPDNDLQEAHDLFMQIVNAIENTGATVSALAQDANLLAKSASDGQLDVRAEASKHKGAYRNIIQGFNNALDNLIRPVNVAAEYIDRISKGDIPPKITDEYKGDFNELKNNINVLIDSTNSVTEAASQLANGNTNIHLKKRCAQDEMIESVMKVSDSLKSLIDDTSMLSKSAIYGKLDTRADASKHQGDFKKIVDGVNLTLNTIVNCLEAVPTPIQFMDKNFTIQYINKAGANLLGKTKEQLQSGNFTCAQVWDTQKCRTNECPCQITMDTKGVHTCENELVYNGKDMHIFCAGAPLKDESGEIVGSFEFVTDQTEVVTALNEAEKLKQVSQEKAFWYEQILDAIPSPISVTDMDMNWTFINKAAEAVAGQSRNDVVGKSCNNWGADICGTDKCGIHGLKNNKPTSTFNQPGIDMDFRVDSAYILDSNGKRIGHIEVVTDVTEITKKADYNKIGVEKLSENLALLAKGELNLDFSVDEGNKYTAEDKENFMKINKSFETARDAILSLVDDAKMLSQAAKNGQLSTRADIISHHGDFRSIVQGFNDTLDNVIGPLNVAADYVDRIAQGDIPAKITSVYNGDFNAIKINLNKCIDAINMLVTDTITLSEKATDGQLATRVNADKHFGDYKKIVEGINETLDVVIQPINEAGKVLGVMATGDLSVRMKGDYKGDLAKLKNDINTLADSLNDLIARILDGVETTASSSIQISSTADTIATSAQEQSAQTEEVASAIEEMARTVTENASNAQKTADVARQNREVAKEGGSIVEQTVSKMSDIAAVVKESAGNIEKLGESSKQIGEIISVIDDIADQTNLLALNAAIEAARAGEQGRGFAVVADEVRKLAERTTEATKKIAHMIKGIQKDTENAVRVMQNGNSEVSNGILLADKAGAALKEIVVSSQHLLDMISQIATANEEQAATGEEITKNVSMISEVTHDSSRRITEIAQSSEELSKLTEDLRSLVQQFKIHSTDYEINPPERRKSLSNHGRFLPGNN